MWAAHSVLLVSSDYREEQISTCSFDTSHKFISVVHGLAVNNVIIISDYGVLNGWRIWRMVNLKPCGRESVWPNLRYSPGICLEILRKTTDSCTITHLSQNFNLDPSNIQQGQSWEKTHVIHAAVHPVVVWRIFIRTKFDTYFIAGRMNCSATMRFLCFVICQRVNSAQYEFAAGAGHIPVTRCSLHRCICV
jgi:hypothetical protein